MKNSAFSSKALCAIGLILASLAAAPAQNQGNLPALGLNNVFPGLKFNRPLWVEEVPDGSKRLIVIEQGGTVYLLPEGRASKDVTPFLDISSRRPWRQNEEGLLGFAFHPKFKDNGLFYIFYSQHQPLRSILSEVKVSATNRNTADLASERILMEFRRPYWNHDGCTLLFGRDGYLYLSVGDGGAANDPHNAGQNLKTVLAKILRIDVNSRTGPLPYGIPKDNPFFDGNAANISTNLTASDRPRPEIWAYGLRNAWRMSFDRETGELWAGDVGQNEFEEIVLVTKGGNYGWSVVEAFHPFKPQQPVTGSAPIDPIIEYAHNPRIAPRSKFPDHGVGVSVTGGYVYRGKKLPALRGVYVYADFEVGTIFGLRYEQGKLASYGVLVPRNPLRKISSFAEDLDGELFITAFDGNIYEFVPAQP